MFCFQINYRFSPLCVFILIGVCCSFIFGVHRGSARLLVLTVTFFRYKVQFSQYHVLNSAVSIVLTWGNPCIHIANSACSFWTLRSLTFFLIHSFYKKQIVNIVEGPKLINIIFMSVCMHVLDTFPASF